MKKLLRIHDSSVLTSVDYDLEMQHDEAHNEIKIDIINKTLPAKNITFMVDHDELDVFVGFIHEIAKDMKNIQESEESDDN